MNTEGLTAIEIEATREAMVYWTEHWDWECPLFFGVELGTMTELVISWPAVEDGKAEVIATCALGAWRELLYGASSIEPHFVQATVGISYDAAERLCTKIRVLANEV